MNYMFCFIAIFGCQPITTLTFQQIPAQRNVGMLKMTPIYMRNFNE